MKVVLTTVVMLLISPFIAPAMAAAPQATAPVMGAPDSASNVSSIYKLGGGDKIHVIVYNEADLTGDFAIDGQGKVSLPLIGAVPAAGLTVSELTESVTEKLKGGYLLDPKVSIEVTTFRPYYIMGEVNKAGEYPYTDGLNVINAVARAEGFTYRAQEKRVYIKHAGEMTEQLVPLTTDLKVLPGDTIRIAERHW